VKVRLSDEAQRDIDALYAYYDAWNDAVADRIVAALLGSLRGLGHFPLLGKSGRYSGTRAHIVLRYGYRITYEVDEGAATIGVIRILHRAQRWPPETPIEDSSTGAWAPRSTNGYATRTHG